MAPVDETILAYPLMDETPLAEEVRMLREQLRALSSDSALLRRQIEAWVGARLRPR
jgi:hypothetical protein